MIGRASSITLMISALLATASCGVLYQPEPIFGGPEKYVFGDHRADPVLPGDAVTTKQQAIQLAMKNCPPTHRDTDLGFWDAHIEGNSWLVYYEHNTESVSVKINKSNGAFEDCQVNDQDQ